MKIKNLKIWIEIYGWSGLILLFASIWISSLRWKLFWTSILCFVITIINFANLKYREKSK